MRKEKQKFISLTRSIKNGKAGESFVSTFEAKNVASEFFRQGVKGTTRKAFLLFPDTGETIQITVATIKPTK